MYMYVYIPPTPLILCRTFFKSSVGGMVGRGVEKKRKNIQNNIYKKDSIVYRDSQIFTFSSIFHTHTYTPIYTNYYFNNDILYIHIQVTWYKYLVKKK